MTAEYEITALMLLSAATLPLPTLDAEKLINDAKEILKNMSISIDLGGLSLALNKAIELNRTYNHTTEIHHIVAKNSNNPFNLISRGILGTNNIKLDSDKNLVEIRTGFHKHMHTDIYYGWVALTLISAQRMNNGLSERENVINALEMIKGIIETENMLMP